MSGFKAEMDGLRERMRGLGFSYDEVAAEVWRRYPVRPRQAYRLAWGWTLDQVAEASATWAGLIARSSAIVWTGASSAALCPAFGPVKPGLVVAELARGELRGVGDSPGEGIRGRAGSSGRTRRPAQQRPVPRCAPRHGRTATTPTAPR